MSPTSRRRRGPDQGHHDAASEYPHDSTARPTREQALDAFVLLLAYAMGQSAEPKLFTQRRLPPDATSEDAYLRKHRVHTKARTPGWTKSGKTRAVTSDAWAASVAAETSRAQAQRPAIPVVVAPPDVGAAIDRALGIRLRAS